MRDLIRRIVTGHKEDTGESIVLLDDRINWERAGNGLAYFAKPWTTATSPVDNDDASDGALRESGLTLQGGTVLRYVDFPPGCHSPMHRTSSLDYGIVLSGNLEMELDGGKRIALSPHDVVVQRGTIHAWHNISADWARMAFILIDATPATVNGITLQPENRGHR